MKTYTAEFQIYEKPQRGRMAKCLLTGQQIAPGEAVIRVMGPQQTRPQYITEAAWRELATVDQMAATVFGSQAAHGCQFQFVYTGELNMALTAAMVVPNGKQAAWHRVANGIASPRYANGKWHDKLETLSSMPHEGTVTLRVWHEGELRGFKEFDWRTRDELKRFVKKLENKTSTLEALGELKEEVRS